MQQKVTLGGKRDLLIPTARVLAPEIATTNDQRSAESSDERLEDSRMADDGCPLCDDNA